MCLKLVVQLFIRLYNHKLFDLVLIFEIVFRVKENSWLDFIISLYTEKIFHLF